MGSAATSPAPAELGDHGFELLDSVGAAVHFHWSWGDGCLLLQLLQSCGPDVALFLHTILLGSLFGHPQTLASTNHVLLALVQPLAGMTMTRRTRVLSMTLLRNLPSETLHPMTTVRAPTWQLHRRTGPCCWSETFLREQFFSQPDAFGGAIVRKSQSGGGGARKLTRDIHETRSWRQPR